MDRPLDRRQFTTMAAAVAALGTAGCFHGGDDPAAPGDNQTDDQDGLGGDEDGGGDGMEDGDGDGGAGDAEGRADTWLSDNDANLYEGDLADQTGQDEITIDVGAGDQSLAFDPPGVRIDTGTNVVWEWTGEGAAHNVVPQGDSDFEDFGQEEQTDEAGHTVEYTFDEAGVGLYLCEPHETQGMYGAVVVE